MLSKAQIRKLQKEYAEIETIDPCSEAAKKLLAFLDKLPEHQLKELEKANIKFISRLARNRLRNV